MNFLCVFFTGKLELKNVEAVPPYKYALIKDSDDVFILDCTTDIFVWYGPKAIKNKKKKTTGMQFVIV